MGFGNAGTTDKARLGAVPVIFVGLIALCNRLEPGVLKRFSKTRPLPLALLGA